jgi:hypothetical protein
LYLNIHSSRDFSIAAMSTLHLFPLLPFELCAQIWESTVEPRTIEVRITRVGLIRTRHLRSSTPIPAPLQSCQKARNQKLYHKVFSGLETHHDAEKRYVWLNLDIDIVDIGTRYCSDYAKVGTSIRRLKIARVNQSEHLYGFESLRMETWFPYLREMHVVCMDGFLTSASSVKEGHDRWPCVAENLYFIDARDGRVVRGCELEGKCTHMLREAPERGDTSTASSLSPGCVSAM